MKCVVENIVPWQAICHSEVSNMTSFPSNSMLWKLSVQHCMFSSVWLDWDGYG